MTYTLSTSGAAVRKAGYGVNSTIAVSGAALDNWNAQDEARVNFLTNYDWVGNYSGLSSNFVSILDDTVSSMTAIKLISYDTKGYNSADEWTTLLDINYDIVTRNLKTLSEEANKSTSGAS